MSLNILIFCFIQGLTEFLPVSSQGHLIVFNSFFNVESEYLSLRDLNIIVHFGSLVAIIIYYYKDCLKMFFSLPNFFRSDIDRNVFLLKNLIVSSFPIFLVGYLITAFVNENFFSSLHIIAWTSLLFGILILLIDKACLRIKNLENLGLQSSLIIGIFQ